MAFKLKIGGKYTVLSIGGGGGVLGELDSNFHEWWDRQVDRPIADALQDTPWWVQQVGAGVSGGVRNALGFVVTGGTIYLDDVFDNFKEMTLDINYLSISTGSGGGDGGDESSSAIGIGGTFKYGDDPFYFFVSIGDDKTGFSLKYKQYEITLVSEESEEYLPQNQREPVTLPRASADNGPAERQPESETTQLRPNRAADATAGLSGDDPIAGGSPDEASRRSPQTPGGVLGNTPGSPQPPLQPDEPNANTPGGDLSGLTRPYAQHLPDSGWTGWLPPLAPPGTARYSPAAAADPMPIEAMPTSPLTVETTRPGISTGDAGKSAAGARSPYHLPESNHQPNTRIETRTAQTDTLSYKETYDRQTGISVKEYAVETRDGRAQFREVYNVNTGYAEGTRFVQVGADTYREQYERPGSVPHSDSSGTISGTPRNSRERDEQFKQDVQNLTGPPRPLASGASAPNAQEPPANRTPEPKSAPPSDVKSRDPFPQSNDPKAQPTAPEEQSVDNPKRPPSTSSRQPDLVMEVRPQTGHRRDYTPLSRATRPDFFDMVDRKISLEDPKSRQPTAAPPAAGGAARGPFSDPLPAPSSPRVSPSDVKSPATGSPPAARPGSKNQEGIVGMISYEIGGTVGGNPLLIIPGYFLGGGLSVGINTAGQLFFQARLSLMAGLGIAVAGDAGFNYGFAPKPNKTGFDFSHPYRAEARLGVISGPTVAIESDFEGVSGSFERASPPLVHAGVQAGGALSLTGGISPTITLSTASWEPLIQRYETRYETDPDDFFKLDSSR